MPEDGLTDAGLMSAIAEYGLNSAVPRQLQRWARNFPEQFLATATSLLEFQPESAGLSFVARILCRNEALFDYLTDPLRLTLHRALGLFRKLLVADPGLDFRLAQRLPGRSGSMDPASKTFSREQITRAIELLDKSSPGQRLISLLGHLPNSSDERISSKAGLFLGRRAHSPAWLEKQLTRDDPRLRANVLEAAWDRSDLAIETLEKCSDDPNNRVAGNALIGLHRAGSPDLPSRAVAMSFAEQPERRSTAAWAMGRIGDAIFVDRLRELVRDEHPKVRGMAVRALSEIRRAESNQSRAIAAVVNATAPEPAIPEIKKEAPPEIIELNLDGSSFRARRR